MLHMALVRPLPSAVGDVRPGEASVCPVRRHAAAADSMALRAGGRWGGEVVSDSGGGRRGTAWDGCYGRRRRRRRRRRHEVAYLRLNKGFVLAKSKLKDLKLPVPGKA